MRLHPAQGLVLVAAIVAGCGPAAVAVSSPPSPASTVVSTAAASAAPVLPTITPDATISVAKPAILAFDGTAVWVFSSTGEVTRIDPATNAPGPPTMIAPAWTWGGFGANTDGLWIGDFDANLVYRVDPVSLKVLATIPVEFNPDGAGVSADGIWIAQHRGGSVTRIDPATNKGTTVSVGNPGAGGPHEIGFGAGSVWVSAGNSVTDSGSGGAVVRIDPATNKVVASIPMPAEASACGGFAISDGAVWTNGCFDQPTLVRIDPRTNKVVASIALGGFGGQPVLIGGYPWLTVKQVDGGPDPARLVRIDPATNTVDRIVSLGETYTGERMLLALGSAWTADWANNRVLRLPLAAFGP